MSDLESRLASFGMGQYFPRFVEAGFESWETILDITEDDMDSLGVQRGHRRRLQQQIAYSLSLGAAAEDQQSKVLNKSLPKADNPPSTGNGRKRQHTRRPKPDSKAPQRPPTAYVLFSNALRDELEGQPLSSVEKSKTVGDRWDRMPEADKSPWRQEAARSWEKYKSDQTCYQNTDDHRDYQAYLADFNAPQSSKRRMVPSNNSSSFVDSALPHPKLEHPSASDAQSSSVTRHLAPAPAIAPALAPALNQTAAESSPLTAPRRRKKPPSHRRDTSSPTAPHTRGKSAQVFSHACESCRKRKVKCDGAVPACERCLKTSIECVYEGGIRDQEKRLVEAVVEKLNVWEEAMRKMKPRLKGGSQGEVDRLLSLPPRTLKPGKLTVPSRSDGSYGGESDVSNVGSMGSTDNINEETFRAENGDGRIEAFLGQTATDNWVDRLQKSLNIADSDNPREIDRSSNVPEMDSQLPDGKQPSATTELSNSILGAPVFGEHFEPYELPTKASADSFVGAYFTTVHPSFPIISRAGFLQNYEEFFTFSRPDSTFVPILHLVLAIGAFHAYATQVPWVREERTQLLDFAKVKAAVLDAHVLQATAYEQVQLCGLGALYYLVMYEVNKAWNVAGLALRCAQALGMHLINRTPNMTDSQRDLRLSIWFSVLSLERTITTITGRPSMIRDIDCSVLPPVDGTIDPDKHLLHPTHNSSNETWSSAESAQRANLDIPSGQTWSRISTLAVTVDPTFFLRHVELSSIANSAVSKLYSSHIRHSEWSDIQLTIRELNQKLNDWNDNLPEPYVPDTAHQKPEGDPVRAAVGMLFHSARVIINRPCHCRLDFRITDQSIASDSFNIDSARQCVASAMGILALVPDQPDPAVIYQGPLWWMGFHHLKRAAAVLIQEVTLLSKNAPAKGRDVLTDAKKAINWLHAMGTFSSPAYSSWVTLSRLLLRATRRFGGDIGSVHIAEEDRKEDHNTFAAKGIAAPGGQDHQSPGSMMEIDGQDFQPGIDDLGFDYDLFGDMNFDGWDQFNESGELFVDRQRDGWTPATPPLRVDHE